MKKIWTYDRLSGLYQGESEADMDPMSPGKWLMPAFSTDKNPPTPGPQEAAAMVDGYWRLIPDWRGVPLYGAGEAGAPVALVAALNVTPMQAGATATPPPAVGAHEVAFFEGGQWVIKPDWRGTALWNRTTGAPDSVTAINALPADANLTDVAPPGYPATFAGAAWAPNLPAIRTEKWEAIKAERDRRTLEGGYRAGSDWFHSDTFSRTQHIGLKDRARDALAAGGLPGDVLQISGEPVWWKTMGGKFINVTVQLAFDIVAAAGESDAALFKAAEAHRAAMDADEAPWAYDLRAMGSWPMSFAG